MIGRLPEPWLVAPAAFVGLGAPAGEALGVVPVLSRRGQWLWALLPYLVVAAAVLVAGVGLWLLRRRVGRRLGALLAHWKAGLAAAALLALGIGVGVRLFLRYPQGRSPSPSSPAPSAAAAWRTFKGGCDRTGGVAGSRAPAIGRKVWAFRDGLSAGAFAASPAVFGDRVYVGSDHRKLYCLDAFTGRAIWQVKVAHEIFASPVVTAERLYIGEGLHDTTDARLYCLATATGEELWTFQTRSHIEFSPTLFDARLYFCAGDDGVYCLDARSGGKLWRHAAARVNMSPAVTEAGVFFGNVGEEPSFVCLDPREGKPLWKRPAPEGVCASPATDGRRVVFGLGNGTFGMSHARPAGAVWCLDAADGHTIWRRPVGDAVLTAVALSGGSAYFGSRDGRLYCLDALSGSVRWSFATGGPVLSSPAVVEQRVVFGSDDGWVYCLDAVSGKPIWKYDTSQLSFHPDARVISSPAVARGRLYIGSMNAYFLCLGEPLPRAAPRWKRGRIP
jgi:outer membrane protein assembly factor BamB